MVRNRVLVAHFSAFTLENNTADHVLKNPTAVGPERSKTSNYKLQLACFFFNIQYLGHRGASTYALGVRKTLVHRGLLLAKQRGATILWPFAGLLALWRPKIKFGSLL